MRTGASESLNFIATVRPACGTAVWPRGGIRWLRFGLVPNARG